MLNWWNEFLTYAGTEDGERAIKGVLAILGLIGAFLLWFFGVIGKLWALFFGAKKDAAPTQVKQVRDNARGGFAEADQGGIATVRFSAIRPSNRVPRWGTSR